MKSIQLLLISIYLLFFSNMAFSQTATAQEGILKWKYTITDFSSIPPLMAPDGTIYLSRIRDDEDQFHGKYKGTNILALNPEGDLKWEFKMGFNYLNRILAVDTDGLIYFTAYYLLGLDSRDHYLFYLYPDGTENKNYPIIVDTGAFGDNKYFTFKSTYSPTAYFYILKPGGNLTTLDISAGQPFIGIDGLFTSTEVKV